MAALLCPAAKKEPVHLETTAPAPEPHDDLPVSRPRVIRELVIGGSAILVGLLVAPLLTFMMGHMSLGPYAHGGAARLLADYFTGLGRAAPVFWAVALGPYVMTLLVRLIYFVARSRN
jgi:hypothetical protein